MFLSLLNAIKRPEVPWRLQAPLQAGGAEGNGSGPLMKATLVTWNPTLCSFPGRYVSYIQIPRYEKTTGVQPPHLTGRNLSLKRGFNMPRDPLGSQRQVGTGQIPIFIPFHMDFGKGSILEIASCSPNSEVGGCLGWFLWDLYTDLLSPHCHVPEGATIPKPERGGQNAA